MAEDRNALVQNLKQFMITELKLKRSPDSIRNDAKLFGPEGLGVDSLDGIQLGLAAEKKYGVKINPSTDDGRAALASVNSLADYLVKHGVKS